MMKALCITRFEHQSSAIGVLIFGGILSCRPDTGVFRSILRGYLGTERSNLVKSGGIVVAWLAARSHCLLKKIIAKNPCLFHDQLRAMDQLSG